MKRVIILLGIFMFSGAYLGTPNLVKAESFDDDDILPIKTIREDIPFKDRIQINKDRDDDDDDFKKVRATNENQIEEKAMIHRDDDDDFTGTSTATSTREREKERNEIRDRNERENWYDDSVRERLADKFRNRVDFHLYRTDMFVGLMVDKFYAMADRLDTLADRIDSRIAKVKEDGVDTSESEADMVIAHEKIDLAISMIANIPNNVSSTTASTTDIASLDDLRSLIESYRDTINGVKNAFRDAHKALIDAIIDLKPGLNMDDGNQADGTASSTASTTDESTDDSSE